MSIFRKLNKLPKKALYTALLSIFLIGGATMMGIKNYNGGKKEETFVSREREYTVSKGNITAGFNGSGSLTLENVGHNFSQSVILEEIFVRPGQMIDKGDKLAKISNDYLNEKYEEVNAQLKEAQVSLESAISEKKEAKNSNPKISKTELNRLDSQINLAQSNVKKAQNEVYKINQLKKSPILYSKIDGVVSSINGIVGVETTLETSIIDVGDISKIKAQINISQNDIVKVEKDQEVTLKIGAYEDDEFKGEVDFINLTPKKEGNSTSYSVEVELEKSDYKLLDGMTATAEFIQKEVKNVLILPNKAIVLKNGQQYVKIKQEDGTTKELAITTGFSDGKNTEILSGLKEGDTVVTGG